MEYDPERGLWVPGRRSFLFMFGAALVGAVSPGREETILDYVIEWDPMSCESLHMRVAQSDPIHGILYFDRQIG